MNPITIAFNQMAEQLEERSDGRLKITLYPNNTLGDTRANIESMQNGSVQIGEGSITHWPCSPTPICPHPAIPL